MKTPTPLSPEEISETRKNTDETKGDVPPTVRKKRDWPLRFLIVSAVIVLIMIGAMVHDARRIERQKQERLRAQPAPAPLYPPSGVFDKKPADQLLEQLRDLKQLEDAADRLEQEVNRYQNKWPQPTPHQWIAPTPAPMLPQGNRV